MLVKSYKERGLALKDEDGVVHWPTRWARYYYEYILVNLSNGQSVSAYLSCIRRNTVSTWPASAFVSTDVRDVTCMECLDRYQAFLREVNIYEDH